MIRMELTDEEYGLLEPLLPPERPKKSGRPWAPYRVILNGIFWDLRTGAPWRDLPERYGPWQTVYERFSRWQSEGLWKQIVDRLLGQARQRDGIDWSFGALDSTVVRAHPAAVGACRTVDGRRLSPEESMEKQALGKSRGGLSTKIHAVVEGAGSPLVVSVSPGQQADVTQALPLVDAIQVAGQPGRPRKRLAIIAGDKAYDSQPLRNELRSRGTRPVLAHRRNRQRQYPARAKHFDKQTYRRRNVVERMIRRLKEFRRIATRYEKLATNFLAMIMLGIIRIWMKKLLSDTP